MQPRARAAETGGANKFLFAISLHHVVFNLDRDGSGFAIEQAGDFQLLELGIDFKVLHLPIAGDQAVRPSPGSSTGKGIFGGVQHRMGRR